MERIKEYLWKVKNSPVVFQEDCEAEVNEVNKEITTYLIGEVEKLKKEHSGSTTYSGICRKYGCEICKFNQALDEVEKMLKGEK